MCGIAGIHDYEGSAESLRRLLSLMNAAMVHRGPDDEGMHIEPGLRTGIAVRRLSIVDQEHGAQPLFNEDRSIVVVCNGEIYNHRALRRELQGNGYRLRSHSDCEVLAHLYEEEGAHFLKRLNGMFALAVLDRRTNTLLLARDPIGMKHLYWSRTPHGVAFASEARALFATGLVSPRPDWTSLGSYLSIGWVPSPGTAFAGLQRLEPGSYVLLRGDRIEQGRYWVPRYGDEDTAHNAQDYSEELRALLDGAVASHLDADVPAGLFLSGGWDSSLVSLYAARRCHRPLKSYSLRFPDDPGDDESRYFRPVVDQIGSDNSEIEVRDCDVMSLLEDTVTALEEPVVTAPTQLGHLLSRHAARDLKMVLGGEGSDELFAGYDRFRDSPLHRIRRVVPHGLVPPSVPVQLGSRGRRALRFLAAPDDERAHLELLSLSLPRELVGFLRDDVPLEVRPGPGAVSVTAETRSTFRDDLDMKLALELTGRLADGILFAHDKTAMAHSLEVRMPFLDLEVVRFALRLPSALKVRGRVMKAVLEPLARELPPIVAQRPKQGLRVPWRIYRSGTLRRYFVETILDTSRTSGLFDHRRLEPWVRAHAASSHRRAAQLWPICHFCLWWNRFIGGDAGVSPTRTNGSQP